VYKNELGISSFKNQMRKLPFILSILIFSQYAARAQVSFGTVVVFNFSEDQLVVAADSRAVVDNGSRPPDDSQCKIATFNHQTIFVTGGTAVRRSGPPPDPVGGWRNLDLARNALSIVPKDHSTVRTIASAWANIVVGHWKLYYPYFPQSVLRIAGSNKGVLTYGFFAEAHAGVIEHTIVLVSFNATKTDDPVFAMETTLNNCWLCGQSDAHLCATGTIDVAKEFCFELDSSKRTKSSRHQRLPGLDGQESLAIEAVDMSSACDITEVIGGPTDAVELTSDGNVVWLRNNKRCQEE